MNQPETPNPERRSTNAMICFCTGLGLVALSWFMGVGTAFTAAFAGGLSGLAMGVTGSIALMLTACVGAFLMFIGIVWIVIRVIADQTGDEAKQRYKNVQR
jgi:hypothetical protein